MKLKRQKLIFVITGIGILLISLSLKSLLLTNQNRGSQLAWAMEQGSEAKGQAGEGHGAPFIYYVNWLLLIISLGLVGSQLKVRLKKPAEHAEEHHAAPAGAWIPIFLIGVVVFIFLTESLSAVANYHEPVGPGLIRLLIKLTAGVLLMLYGLSFMHEH